MCWLRSAGMMRANPNRGRPYAYPKLAYQAWDDYGLLTRMESGMLI